MTMQQIAIETLPSGGAPIRVGEIAIDEAEIAREMQHHPADSADGARDGAVRALVVRELLRQRAQMLGLDGDDEAAVATLLEQELPIPEPDEADCRRYFDAHRERFGEPARLSVRHILLAAAPDDAEGRDAGYRQGSALIDELAEHPERFTDLARRHSACPSKESGGELGWLTPGQTVAELDRALQTLPQGLHDRPLASRYGWHVVCIDERHDACPQPFEAVAERVRHTLCEQASRRALRHYLLALEAEIGVTGFRLDDDAEGALMQ